MDGLVLKYFHNSEYGVLTPNLWKKHFRMHELDAIMRQRDSKLLFAEILNRLREGKHTEDDILKIKERIVLEQNCPQQATHLFIQNSMVDEFNNQVHEAATGRKYTKAQDSVIGANSAELRDKIMKQIPKDPCKTKQLASKLQIAEHERTEIAINVRTDDGLTNGASNIIIKLVQLHQPDKPSGIIWVQFDQQGVEN